MRILITGASGFIGQHLVPLLMKDKHQVLALSRKKGVGSIAGLTYLKGDMNRLALVEKDIIRFKPDVCIHLAWEGIPDYSYEVSKCNLDASIYLFNMLVNKTSCRKIIASGSSWEYGKTSGVCREKDAIDIKSAFTWAKNAILSYGQMICKPVKIDFIWMRLFFVYGPGQKEHSLIPTLHRAFCMNKNPDIKAPRNAQDFIYVTDAVEAFRLAVKKEVPSGIYNLGTGKAVAVKDICMKVARLMGKSSTLFFDSKLLKKAGVRTWADISLTTKKLDWHPAIDLNEGIKSQIRSLETI